MKKIKTKQEKEIESLNDIYHYLIVNKMINGEYIDKEDEKFLYQYEKNSYLDNNY